MNCMWTSVCQSSRIERSATGAAKALQASVCLSACWSVVLTPEHPSVEPTALPVLTYQHKPVGQKANCQETPHTATVHGTLVTACLTLLTSAWQSRPQEVQTPLSSRNRARRRAPPLDRVQNLPSQSALCSFNKCQAVAVTHAMS